MAKLGNSAVLLVLHKTTVLPTFYRKKNLSGGSRATLAAQRSYLFKIYGGGTESEFSAMAKRGSAVFSAGNSTTFSKFSRQCLQATSARPALTFVITVVLCTALWHAYTFGAH